MKVTINSRFSYSLPILQTTFGRRPGITLGALIEGRMTRLYGLYDRSNDLLSRFNTRWLCVYAQVDLFFWCFSVEINVPYKVTRL